MEERHKFTLTFTDQQLEPVVHVSKRLGLNVPATLRHLVYKSLESSLALNALSDQTDFVSRFFDRMEDIMLDEMASSNTAIHGTQNPKSPNTRKENEDTDKLNPIIPFEDLDQ